MAPPPPRPRAAAHRLRDAHRDTFSTSYKKFPTTHKGHVVKAQSFRCGTVAQTFGGLRGAPGGAVLPDRPLPPHPASAGLRAPARRGAGRNPAPSRDAAAAWASGLRAPMPVLQHLYWPGSLRCQCF